MKKIILITLVFTLGFSACRTEKDSKKLSIHRYEEALFAIDKNDVSGELKRLQTEFAPFLEGADLDDELTVLQMKNFITDPLLIEVNEAVKEKYPDLHVLAGDLATSFSNAFRLLDMPEKYPTVYTYVSSFDYESRIILEDTLLLIALDMYLGKESPFYQSLGIPNYISQRCEREYIGIDVMRAFANAQLPSNMRLQTLLDHMLYQGKMIYFLQKVLPDQANYKFAGYTEKQWKWCKKNEAYLWSYFVQEQLLFEQDYFKIKNFINDGPTTSLFPDSPGRLSAFIGYEIVEKFMSKNNISLKELLSMENANEILQRSGYKGK